MVTFLDLASNVPKISINTTNASEDSGQSYLTTVDGGVGTVTVGVDTIREASGQCCIGGNFSLSFDGEVVAVAVDLEDSNGTARSDNLREGIEDAIDPGEYYLYTELVPKLTIKISTKPYKGVRPYMVFALPV